LHSLLICVHKIIGNVFSLIENVFEAFVYGSYCNFLHDSLVLLNLQDLFDGQLDVEGDARFREVGLFLIQQRVV